MQRSLAVIALSLVVLVIVGIGVAPALTFAADDDPTCDYPLEVTDATGETITIEEEPQQIVTTAPSAAQTMWAFGAEDKVVGLSMHAMFLDGAEDRTNVSANPMEIDIEAVVALEPDLVLAPNVTPRHEIDSLREAGLTVYHAEVSTDIDDIVAKTERLGTIVGECEAMHGTVGSMTATLDEIASAVDDADDHPLVFYASGGGFTAGEGTFQHAALEHAGLTNLAAEVGIVGWEPISSEVLIDEDPEWIIYPDSMTEEQIIEAAEETTAWEEGQVISVNTQHFSQPAPGIVDAIESIHVEIHGELDPATPTPTDPTPTPTDPTPTPSEPTPTPDTEPDAIPGFGIAIAIIALLAAAALARRR